jgi:hypothetical protein
VNRNPLRPAAMTVPRFIPNPRPTTDAWRSSLVGLEVLPANGFPIVSPRDRPRARASGGEHHGVRVNRSSAAKAALRITVFDEATD